MSPFRHSGGAHDAQKVIVSIWGEALTALAAPFSLRTASAVDDSIEVCETGY
jgi:hypothetical protein